MNEDIKKVDQEVGQIVNELRETINKKSVETAESKEKIEKMTDKLLKLEEANQKLVTEQTKAYAESEAQKERFIELETKLCRFNSSVSVSGKSETMKNFEELVRYDSKQLAAREFKYLRTDNNVDGGYLAPDEFVAEIIKKITETSPIRQLARIRTSANKAMEMPTRASLVTGYWVGEGKGLTASNSTYGKERIPFHKLTGLVEITWEELQDAAFNMETEINSDIAEIFAQLEGTAFVNGDAVTKPEGFMVNANVATINSGVADDFVWDNFPDMIGSLKVGYNPVFGFNRLTLAEIMKKKDGTGRYLWTPGNLAAGIPNAIYGVPYVLMPDLDNVGADNYPIVLGDFAKGYLIGDKTQMGLIKDEVTKADEGKVRLVFVRRLAGQVILPEALKKLKCST